MSLMHSLSGRRTSLASQGSGIPAGSIGGGLSVESGGYESSSSDWPDDASDKESLQSWAKEQQEKEAEDEDDLFASKEEQHLRRWFIVISFALMIVGVCVSVFTYYYLVGQEQDNFEIGVSMAASRYLRGETLISHRLPGCATTVF